MAGLKKSTKGGIDAEQIMKASLKLATEDHRTLLKKASKDDLASVALLQALAASKEAHATLLRLSDLVDRVEALEAHGIKYVGVYQPSGDYERGHIVTHQGSAWHAVRPTRAVPGSSGDWQLMVKAGRDARGS
ncbi:hypothetical protein [Arenimonas sp.]|uniref:hypothetical protein n=1 Tax=Arenimonas sp. TaxID=1872635 RepID=UPI0035AECBC3